MSKLTLSPAWKALAAHRERIAAASLADLFAADPSRAERFSIEAGELVLDYSKHRVDAETMRLLAGLAAQAQLPSWIARMFAGDPINNTEARAALHVALRSGDATFRCAARSKACAASWVKCAVAYLKAPTAER